jgi:peptidyl-prolyl cis-trans isomerase D
MQKHRKYLVVTIWVSTISFVGAGFVGWGAYSFSENKADTVAKVGDIAITGKDLQSTYSNIYGYYNQLLGGKLTKEKAEELKLVDVAKEQLIQEALLLSYADDLGITALKSEIVSKIHSMDVFKKDKVFNNETYKKVLISARKDITDYENSVKKEIVISKLKNALNLPETSLELETVGASVYLQDKISLKISQVKDSDISVTQEEVKNYWNDNKAKYLSDKSYTIQSIKVASADIAVDEKDMLEFYNEKKHLFKGDDDKIIKFEDAKEKVKDKLQHKYAKKATLKKYLAFKDGEINATDTMTVTEKNSSIPLDKVVTAKVESFIKAIELKDGYMTAKLVSINEPKILEFEKAKEKAKVDLTISKKAKLIKEKAENEKLTDAKDLGFLTKGDVDKVTDLDTNEARMVLNYIFSKEDKKGYYLFSDKAVNYEITEQKLITDEKLKQNNDALIKQVLSIKKGSIESNLLEQLRKKYEIQTN